jgi:hypothetical protein
VGIIAWAIVLFNLDLPQGVRRVSVLTSLGFDRVATRASHPVAAMQIVFKRFAKMMPSPSLCLGVLIGSVRDRRGTPRAKPKECATIATIVDVLILIAAPHPVFKRFHVGLCKEFS